jgi:hypothetical protein
MKLHGAGQSLGGIAKPSDIKDVCSKIDGLPDRLIAAIQKILDLKNLAIPQTKAIDATA